MSEDLNEEIRRQMDEEAATAAAELGLSKENSDIEKSRHAQEVSRYQETVITMSWDPPSIREYTRDALWQNELTTTEAPMFSDRWKGLRLYGEMTTRKGQITKALKAKKEQQDEFQRDGIRVLQLIPRPSDYERRTKELSLITIPSPSEMSAITGGIELSPQDIASKALDIYLKNEEIKQQNKQIKRTNKLAEAKDKKYDDDLEIAEANAQGVIEELDRGRREAVTRSKFNTDFERHESAGGSTVEVAKEFLQPKSHHLQTQDFETIFNLPGTEASEAGDTSLGDDIDLALRAYYIIGMCEKKADLERLRGTDGWLKIFSHIEIADNREAQKMKVYKKKNRGDGYDEVKGVLKRGERYEVLDEWPDENGHNWFDIRTSEGERFSVYSQNRHITYVNGKNSKEWIGDSGEWKAEGKRKGMGKGDDVEIENGKGQRGKLTGHGNIWTRKESLSQREAIRQLVRDFVGGPDADVAEELAHRMFKTLGLASSFGTEEYAKKDDGSDDIGQEGFPEADDLVKLMSTGLWQRKEASGNAPAGPENLRGKLDRMAVDFISFQSSKVEHEGEEVERSFKEQWWGYNLDKSRNLGQMAWKEKPKNIMRDWRLRLFFAAREKAGLLDIWTQRKYGPDQLFSVEFFEKFNKMMNILFRNPTVLTNGFIGNSELSTDAQRVARIREIKQDWWIAIKKENENYWLHKLGNYAFVDRKGSYKAKELVEEVFMAKAGFFE